MICEGIFICCLLFSNGPLNIAMYGPFALHHASYCRIALPCIDLRTFFLYVLFGSSRVDTDTEQFEQEYEYHPEEDIACTTTADLTGEPSLLHLFYSFTLVALLLSLCCDSVRVTCPNPPVTHMSHVSFPIPITLCLLFGKPCES